MPSVNETLLTAALAHEIDLHRYSNDAVRRIIGVLNRLDVDLFQQLMGALVALEPEDATENFSAQRLGQQLAAVRALNAAAYARLNQETANEMRSLTGYEVDYQLSLFENVLPASVQERVGMGRINVEDVYAAAMARPFQGRLLNEWADTLDANRMRRIRDAVRMGFVEGQTVEQIVRRIRGSKSVRYMDGIVQLDRRDAEAVVRTALGHTAAYARQKFYEANVDVVKEVKWVSTLDNRTSEMCRLRDGKLYDAATHKPIGHRLPWGGGPGALHWRCRSVSVPITKSWRELGAGAEFDAETRASMDGQVPADLDYGTWLRQQSAARQDEILGPTRGALFRRGGLALERFADARGHWLTLDQLRQRDAAAFGKAGV